MGWNCYERHRLRPSVEVLRLSGLRLKRFHFQGFYLLELRAKILRNKHIRC